MKLTKITLGLILIFFLALYLHNAWFFPTGSGYDGPIHFKYTEIITFEKRIPLPTDTPESYNPPLFYFLSGQMAIFFKPFFNNNFQQALKSWQLLIALFLPIAGYLWFSIFRRLNPKNNWLALLFLVWLMSVPVLNKMAPMYNLEVLQMIETSFVVWFFIKYFLKKPKYSLAVWLGIFAGIMLSTRIMSALLLLSLGISIVLLWWWKRVSFKKMILMNIIFTVITLSIGGWYYHFFKDYGVFDSGENIKDFEGIPLLQRQPKTFYTDTFFRTMMRTPIRERFPNRFIPIFYSTFWGDYWNYYRHRRFQVPPEKAKNFVSNKVKISKERLALLAWQNRINFIPTIIILIGYLLTLINLIKNFFKRKLEYIYISESFLTIFFAVTFTGFFYTNLKFPNLYKGDTIKASFILYAIPVLIYFAIKFLSNIRKRVFIFYFLLLALLISFLFNIHFSYY